MNVLFNLFLVVLLLIAVVGVLAAPLLVRIIAPGFIGNPEKLNLTIALLRLMFPYILLIGLTAYAMAVLNSLKYFALSALAPCMLNISLIVSVLIIVPRLEEPVFGLVAGVLIGGVLLRFIFTFAGQTSRWLY